MQLILASGFTDKELKSYQKVIYGNLYDIFLLLINCAQKNEYSFSSKHKNIISQIIKLENSDEAFTPTQEMEADLTSLWTDKGIKKAYDLHRIEIGLEDSSEYFISRIKELCQSNYIPTVEDILKLRQKTVGIVEKRFKKDNMNLLFVDVGGQRNERRKWIHAFDNVTTIIFVASLGEYDQKLEEDQKKNRMHESLQLFSEVIHERCFNKKNIILFYNKDDVFRKKNC